MVYCWQLQDAGFQQAFEPIRVKFKPTAKDMQTAEESGTGDSAPFDTSEARDCRRPMSTLHMLAC